jgi:hypothetical protein
MRNKLHPIVVVTDAEEQKRNVVNCASYKRTARPFPDNSSEWGASIGLGVSLSAN